MAQELHPRTPATREQAGTSSCKGHYSHAFGEAVILKREFKPTEDDYLKLTVLLNVTEFSERITTSDPVMSDFLVQLRRVRPDLMEWLCTPDGKAKRNFTPDERQYAYALYDDYVLWRLKQSA